ncbi:MAG: TIGR00289 family protein [Candidatus Thermoplasmatota archaeon]|nr:TIGR00289 family protein [Candidatus Thermoplasmatota archaeon]MBU1940866.1 TIGR00289 family protein [Candidatus Thermoplasmatota archaeon]
MKVAALFSGGKDSVYAIYIAQQWGWDVIHLVSLQSKNPASFMYHTINIHLTPLLSKSLRIPLIFAETAGNKETELQDLKKLLSPLNIDGVISGAIASEYQRTRIEEICYDLKLKSFTPLWHKNQQQLLLEQISAGFKIMIVGVFAEGLDNTWLGTILDTKNIDNLFHQTTKYGINSAGEGGEFETLVLDAPLFSQELLIDQFHTIWKRDHGYFQIESAHLKAH